MSRNGLSALIVGEEVHHIEVGTGSCWYGRLILVWDQIERRGHVNDKLLQHLGNCTKPYLQGDEHLDMNERRYNAHSRS